MASGDLREAGVSRLALVGVALGVLGCPIFLVGYFLSLSVAVVAVGCVAMGLGGLAVMVGSISVGLRTGAPVLLALWRSIATAVKFTFDFTV